MKKKATVKRGLRNTNALQVESKARLIAEGIGKNMHLFPDAGNLVEHINELLPPLEKSIHKARSGDKLWLMTRDRHAHAMKHAISETGHYVQLASRGDAAVILASGFEVAKQKAANRGDLKINNLRGSSIRPGSVRLWWQAEKSAVIYAVQYILEENLNTNEWINASPAFKSRVELNGLAGPAYYYIRVAAITKKMQGPWSGMKKVLVG